MYPRTAWYLATVALMAAPPCSAQTRGGPPDTVDVKVGSTLVDFSAHRPTAQRAISTMTMNGQSRAMPPVVWTFSFDDSGGEPRLLVASKSEGAAQPGATPAPPPAVFVFDRKSLALRQVLADDGSVMITVDGLSVRGKSPAPGGASQPLDLTLTEPAFLRSLVDLVAESLPRRTGVVYRLPLWGFSSGTVEHRLYQFVRQEDVEVLGRSYPKAWVLEDRSADGTLMGTMWLVDRPPELVRWIINAPDGRTVQLEQEPADPSS
jgi:hypothetical protein